MSNVFTLGVNRGNPDFYREGRFEIVDNVTKVLGKHTISFGGDFNWVATTESFPLFYPFEADFANLRAFLGSDFRRSAASLRNFLRALRQGFRIQRDFVRSFGLPGDQHFFSYPQPGQGDSGPYLRRALFAGQMASHKQSDDQLRPALGGRNLAGGSA